VPTTTADSRTLYYELTGDGETVVFVNEAGYGAWQWGWQHDQLTGPFETLVWDLPGTGRSDPSADLTVDDLAADLEQILTAAGCRRAHVVGAGLGGMVALRYAREYGRAISLTLVGTAADGGAINEEDLRGLHASPDDPDALRRSLSGAFSEQFLAQQSEIVDQICKWRAEDDADGEAFEAQVGAALSFESGPLYELTLPTLLCHGFDDPVVPVEAGRELAEKLPRGTFEAVEGRHLAFAEHARPVTDRLVAFFDEQDE